MSNLSKPVSSKLSTQFSLTAEVDGVCLWEILRFAGVSGWILDIDTEVVHCSPRLIEWLENGKSGQGRIEDVWSLIPSNDRENVKLAYQQCLSEGMSSVEHTIVAENGQQFQFDHFMTKSCSQEGSNTVIGLLVDVSERKRLVLDLDSARSETESILASVGDGVYAIDENGIITQTNPAAAEMLECKVEDLIGKNAHQTVLHSLPNGEPYDQSQCMLHSTDFPCHVRLEETLWRADGTSFVASCVSTPILTKSGHISGAVITFRDLTEERYRQAAKAQSQKMESIGQLAAGVAHEINTPMQYVGDNIRYVNKVIGGIQELLDVLPKFIDDKVADEEIINLRQTLMGSLKPRKIKSSLSQIPGALEDAYDGVKKVSEIVAAMKEFSYSGASEFRNVCVNHLLESTITVARNEWRFVAEVETNFDENLEEIPVYPSELNQAFLNIIVNAAQAIGTRVERGDFKKGSINVSTELGIDHVVVKIKDNGGGIPESVKDKVFDPFFTTKEVGQGTGQGLSVVHSVVTGIHQGKLSFDVEADEGTTFIVELPRKAADFDTK